MRRHPPAPYSFAGSPSVLVRYAWLACLALATACGDKVDDTAHPDLDGDGWSVMRGDCDDQDPTVNPDAPELCDDQDRDENCNELADDDDPEVLAASQALWFPDGDGDGYAADDASGSLRCEPTATLVTQDQGDCDDDDPAIHPDAQEVCDDQGLDEDCDGLVDDGDDSLDPDSTTAWYPDADGDGFGDPDLPTSACAQPSGHLADGTDCDDADPAIHPDAQEVCDPDDVDEDCDTWPDDIDPSTDRSTRTAWYADADRDGYGDPDSVTEACDQPDWHVAPADLTDCDDTRADVNPDAQEVCDPDDVDEDCDGLVDDDDDSVDPSGMSTWYADADADGYGDADDSADRCDAGPDGVTDATDCDDADGAVNPAATELCDGIDNDCDGDTDEDDASDATWWQMDGDGDGYGDPGTGAPSCVQPTGQVADATDCDDDDGAINPAATELCDGLDNDCDGLVDDDDSALGDPSTWYEDADSDGYGAASTATDACLQPSGSVAQAGDCDDASATVNPDATELCDGLDNDCDGDADEDDAADAATWYADADGDGAADPSASALACSQPSGFVATSADIDCDDADAAQHPGADELCNGEDDDCDGATDEDEAIDVHTWYADVDGDGHGDAASTDIDCDQPTGFVEPGAPGDEDCDDTDASQHPGADERCNGEDDDCDGSIDEDSAVDVLTWYADVDGDGFGTPSITDTDCDQPTGFVGNRTDCDDTDGAQHPGADELCNGEDDDCNGDIDEDSAVDVLTWYADADADGYGDPAVVDYDCTQPSEFVPNLDDCDDSDSAQHPGADERCNGEDDDCDGSTDEDSAVDVLTWYADVDGDGYGDAASPDLDCDQPSGFTADSGDCDDTDAAQHPGADERCNGEDDDCDGAADEDSAVDVLTWYADADADGYGDAAVVDIDCVQPTGFTADSSDCDDSRSDVSPAGLEICDALNADEDCDGLADDADPGVDPTTRTTWYQDLDGDGVGSSAYGSEGPLCDHSAGYSPDDGDCDETSTTIHALHDEICDDIDNDCDAGTTDLGVISVGSSAFTSLAAAVTAAPAGGVVMICDGIHSANVTTSVPITLRSLHGAASTILDGGGTGPVITMGDDLTVEGLVLTGGAGVTGGAIDGSVGGGASLVIDACVFEGNEADSGGAIYAYELDMTIANSELFDNTATSRGGALTIAQGTDLDLGTMELHGNEASYGGAAYLEDQLVSGGAYFENHADYGGGVFLMGATLQGAEIYENLASNSGGGAALDGGAALLGATVQLNLAQSGGGVILQGDDCRLGGHPDSGAATTITLNEATVYGGGLAGFSITDTLLEDTGISDNLAYYGGGIYLQGGGVLTATDLEISSNVASNTGGGIYLLDATRLDIAELVLTDNWAGSSGGGGLLDSCSGAFTVAGATITDNHAGSLGGGLYMVDVAVADITGMTLERNEGMGRQGGGFYLDSGVLLNVAGSFGSGPDANTPDDIGLTGRSFTFTTWAECDSDRLSCSGG